MKVPVFGDGKEIGEVTVREQGNCAEIVMNCRRDDAGVFRGFLACAGGEVPLGILLPVGDCMCVSKRMPVQALSKLGQMQCGYCKLSYSFSEKKDFWQTVEDGFFCSRFCGSICQIKGCLWQPVSFGRKLALPWRCGYPFPLMEVFCFVTLQQIRGEDYAVIAFDGDDYPVMPE